MSPMKIFEVGTDLKKTTAAAPESPLRAVATFAGLVAFGFVIVAMSTSTPKSTPRYSYR